MRLLGICFYNIYNRKKHNQFLKEKKKKKKVVQIHLWDFLFDLSQKAEKQIVGFSLILIVNGIKFYVLFYFF